MRIPVITLLLGLFALCGATDSTALSLRRPRLLIPCRLHDRLFQQANTCLTPLCAFYVLKGRGDYLGLCFARDIPDRALTQVPSPDWCGAFHKRNGIEIEGVLFPLRHDAEGVHFDPEFQREFFSSLANLCVEPIDDIKPFLAPAVHAWQTRAKAGQIGDLVFAPYSPERHAALRTSRHAYGRCAYQDFRRVGTWLVAHDALRPYCDAAGTIVHVLFLWFLLTHPTRHTLPYLAAYLLGISIIGGGSLYLRRRHECAWFWRPKVFTVLCTSLLSAPLWTLILLPILSFPQYPIRPGISWRAWKLGIFWTVGWYLVASLLQYLYARIRHSPSLRQAARASTAAPQGNP